MTTNPPDSPPDSPPDRRAERLRLGTLVRLLVLAIALGLLLALVLDPRVGQRLLAPEPGYDLVLQGAPVRVPPEAAERLGRHSAWQAERGREHATAVLHAVLAAELDALFDEFHGRLPAYADWYFSLTGEYARLSMLLLQRTGLSEGDYLADRAATLIFGNVPLGAQIGAIEARLQSEFRTEAAELQAAWLAQLLRLTTTAQPVATDRAPRATLTLDDLAAEFSGHGRSEFLTRISATSVGAGGLAAAPILTRLAAGSAGALSGRAAARGVSRAGAAGASALGCAATGPAVLGCALVVGGAAWVATDWALLNADEWRNRDALINEWDAHLQQLRTEFEDTLRAHYEPAIAAWHAGLQLEVERSFSPLQAIKRTEGERLNH